MDWQDLLGQVQDAASQMEKALEQGNLSLKDQVEAGQALWRISNRAQRALDPIKISLRREADARANGMPGTQFFHGRSQGSRCTIVIPAPGVRVREGMSASALQSQLGPEFDRFFRTVVQPRPDFSERAQDAPPTVLQILMSSVDTSTDTPRVSFLE